MPRGVTSNPKASWLDGWLEEDDPVRGHPRDPYHRFDCNHTSELVVVHVGGHVVAETRRAIKLFETSIPPRYYIPIVDVTVFQRASTSISCNFH